MVHPLHSTDRSRESEKQTEMSKNRHRLTTEVEIQIARIYVSGDDTQAYIYKNVSEKIEKALKNFA